MRRAPGFTLIEVMIAVAIVAILAAVALPSYTEYIRRGQITDAVSVLSSMRIKMEQHFQDNRTWDAATNTCNAGAISALPASSPSSKWDFTCDNLSGTTYRVVATGRAGTPMAGAVYTLNQANVRTATPPTGWSNSGCGWVLKKDGSC
jgi:type IV pilus assembly protein PilE